MASSGEAPVPAPAPTTARWPSFVFLTVLIGGMCAAAWQAGHRGAPDTPRDLTVLAPEGAELSMDGATSRIPVAEGIHAFSVTPGAHRLEVSTPSGPGLERTLTVPPGIGPLMIEVRPGPGGQLQIGFY